MWPYIIMAAASIGQGIAANNANKQNALNTSIASHYNARWSLETGISNANAITSAAMANNMMVSALSKLNADDTWDIANYNADLRMMVGNYNAQLLEQEAFDIWEAAELDVTQVENQGKRLAGNILASYGASGAQINETDSVADALIDANTQIELEKFIIRHGADMRASSVQNEAARNRWDGYAAAKQIIFEGSKSAMSALASGAAQIVGNTAQAQIDASVTYENAKRASQSIQMGGWADAESYKIAGNQALANGLFSAASSIAAGYAKGASAGAGTTPSSTPTRLTSWSEGIGQTRYGNMSATLLTSGETGSRYANSVEPLWEQ